MKKTYLKIVYYPVVTCLVVLANYGLIQQIIIPDECYYHFHDTNFIFDIFYNTTDSAANGHPYPTVFNLVFTVLIGILISRVVIKKIMDWNNI